MKTNQRKILIIDDTPEDRYVCQRFLAQDADWCYEFSEADKGAEALALVAAAPPDCILLDYTLPDADGLALLAELTSVVNAAVVPVVMLTGLEDLAVAVEAMQRGAQDYLVKGRFTPADLQRAVTNAIEKAALVNEQRRISAALREREERLSALLQARDELLRKESLARAEAEAARAEAEAARAEAQAASHTKDEFLALISHELRSPLNAMLGWVRVLRAEPTPAMVAKVTEIVERAAKTQQQLIEDLLDSARITTGKLRLEVRPLNPTPLVRAAVDVVRPAAEAKGISLLTAYALEQEQLTGDPERLQQIVWNLLSNAVKFTPTGGQVGLTLERDDPYLCLKVTDTGVGIEPEILPHIFERFRQGAEADGSRRQGGLGLGLSLVKQLVELHGGQISAASAGAGRGATFTVRFPLRAVYVKEENGRRSAGQELAPAPPISPQALAGARLLVLDDEADARLVLTSLFQGYGAEVRAVTSGVEALALLTGGAWQPEVLICDIGLPEEDGYAFMRHVRALPPEQGGKLPAIALTAYNRYPDRLQSLQAGYQMHLAKPVEPLELAVTVASLLGRQWHTVELGR